MPHTVGSIVTALGRIAPLDKAASWDPVGLQIGDPRLPVARVALTHEVTEAVMDELCTFDLVVTYHPLLFSATRQLTAGAGPVGRAFRLVQSATALAVAHTNFDAARGGTADALADELGLAASRPFGPVDGGDLIKVTVFVPHDEADRVAEAMANRGAGRIGNYSACSYRLQGTGTFEAGPGADPTVGEVGQMHREAETRIEMVAPKSAEPAIAAAIIAAHPYEEPAFDVFDVRSSSGMIGRIGLVDETTVGEFASLVEERLGGVVRVAGNHRIATVAVVPGSGGDFISAARREGADLIVTGDVSHHRARAALDAGIAIVDPGHVATERPGVRALYAAVGEIVEDVEMVSADDTDPWERS